MSAAAVAGAKRPLRAVVDPVVIDLGGPEPLRKRRAASAAPAQPALVPNTRAVTNLIALAKPWALGADVVGWLMSEKLDGMRALYIGGALYSRAGNRVYAPDWFLARLPQGVVLDGELFMGRRRFQDVISVCRSQKEKAGWAEVRFVVFDAPEAGGGIAERLSVARESIEVAGGGGGSCEVLEHVICRGNEHVIEELARIEGLGGEGVMLRHARNAYASGRVADLLKVKSFSDDEAVVVTHEAGLGKHGGRMGSLLCRNRAGKMFRVGTGFKDCERDDPPPVGAVVTFKFFELTRAGIPRFPVFVRIRPDIEASAFVL
jgi:DNA ligase 1